jgi:hypothetical protein
MSIECAFFGFLAADADPKTSQAGKQWVRLRVGVGKDDTVQWVGVAVFGNASVSMPCISRSHFQYMRPWEMSGNKLSGSV